jgi:hypothetical protein
VSQVNVRGNSRFLLHLFHFNLHYPNTFIADSRLLFSNGKPFHIRSTVDHVFCSSDTAFNAAILIYHLRSSDFNNRIKSVLFISTFVFRHKLIVIFLLDIHFLYTDSHLPFFARYL